MARTVRILSRASALAKIQAEHVGRALRERWPGLELTYLTRNAAGDRDRTLPLEAADDKGLFTRDLSDALAAGDADVVVHSWKDLPVAARPDTEVAGTLERADVRDVLLIRRDVTGNRPAVLKILTSSPRRVWQLSSSLRPLLPWPVDTITTATIRGNIPTRLDKLLRGEGDGLVVAKAALDRLLDATTTGDIRTRVRGAVERCRWMVLPVREFPSAPAQGALAIEVARKNAAVLSLVRAISHEATMDACLTERRILESYGGGCHEALGATVLIRDFGSVTSVRGRLPHGSQINRWELQRSQRTPPSTDEAHIFPQRIERTGHRRKPVDGHLAIGSDDLWITRSDALPPHLTPGPDQLVWTAGSRTWRHLAARGVWVYGCADGLGEEQPPAVDRLAGRQTRWLRLTHTKSGDPKAIATYEVSSLLPADLAARTHFFWTSGSVFREAISREPAILAGWHASGPGRTAETIREVLGATERVSIWLDYDSWIEQVLRH